MTEILLVANILAVLSITAFIAQYSVLRWERTREGQNAMGVSAACFLLVSAGMVRRLWPEIADHVSTLGFLLVAGAFIWRSVILVQAQREARREAVE